MEFVEAFSPLVITIVIVAFGILGSDALVKASAWLKSKANKDDLGVIDAVTDLVVNFVEKEFTGKAGQIKLSKALEMAREVLGEKGIHISEEELRLAVENGVDKLKERQLSQGMLEGTALMPPRISFGTEPFEMPAQVDPNHSDSPL